MKKECESCVYYDTDRNDQPCCSCYDCLNREKDGSFFQKTKNIAKELFLWVFTISAATTILYGAIFLIGNFVKAMGW